MSFVFQSSLNVLDSNKLASFISPLAAFFSFAAEELQPFPEEWYQHGYIESQQPVTADCVYYDEGSYDTGQQYDDSWVPRWEDDRMGMMEHPVRGMGKVWETDKKIEILTLLFHTNYD